MTFSLLHLLLVGAGGFIGAIGRFAISQFINNKFTYALPIATLVVNLIGSFFLGILIGAGIGDKLLLFLGTGLLGAFTTFSTFKLESIQLHVDKKWKLLVLYNTISYGVGISLAFIGFWIGKALG
ncbi:fluoride efflux transporter CrcB [Thalassobacillus hwangdonensis]|uniref:Fluoride-specific ion channel FluC n=1 Tax=Thalassobacillus hwangdonensis TaxID=546108 RepID=A0ABW3L4D9_9BACI